MHGACGSEANRKDTVDKERERERRAEDHFDWSMEDIGVRGDKMVRLVTSEIDCGERQGDAF